MHLRERFSKVQCEPDSSIGQQRFALLDPLLNPLLVTQSIAEFSKGLTSLLSDSYNDYLGYMILLLASISLLSYYPHPLESTRDVPVFHRFEYVWIFVILVSGCKPHKLTSQGTHRYVRSSCPHYFLQIVFFIDFICDIGSYSIVLDRFFIISV